MARDASCISPGILIFDLKCQLLYSNTEGRLLYMGDSDETARPAEKDTRFDIKRLCFRLKKLAQAQCEHTVSSGHSQPTPIVVASHNQRYRLHGDLIVDENSKDIGIYIQSALEQQKGQSKINLAHYQSTYQLTRRESQILELLSRGASYKEIGYTLTISAHTVRDHIKNLRFKLHADGKCGILAKLIEEASISQEIILGSDAESQQDSSLSHFASDQPRKPVLNAPCATNDTMVLPTMAHAQATSKLRESYATAASHRPPHTPKGPTSRSTTGRSDESWTLNAKREAQPRRKSI